MWAIEIWYEWRAYPKQFASKWTCAGVTKNPREAGRMLEKLLWTMRPMQISLKATYDARNILPGVCVVRDIDVERIRLLSLLTTKTNRRC